MKLFIIGVILFFHGTSCFAASPFFNQQSQDLVEALVSSIDVNANEISEAVIALNEEIGAEVFNVSGDSIILNPSGICQFLQKNADDLVRQIFHDDQDVQSSVIREIHQQIRDQIRPDLEGLEISFSDLSTSRRRKRDLTDVMNELMTNLIKASLSSFVSSIKTTVDAIFANVTSVVSGLYISTNSTDNVLFQVGAGIFNSALDVVLNIISSLKSAVNSFFDQFTTSSSSTNSTDSRRKRDLNLDLDIDSSALETSRTHLRSKRSITSIFSNIWSWIASLYSTVAVYINTYLKTIIVSILSTYYTAVGTLVLLPARCVANYLIDLVFSCSNCTSICS